MTAPFVFHTSIKLPEYTGRLAATVDELLDGIRAVDGSSIFHHTYHFLYQHQFALAQPPTDFAYWVGAVLLDHGLAEELAAVSPVDFPSLHALRERLVEVVQRHRERHGCRGKAPDGMSFYFMRANSLVLRTGHVAVDLASFTAALEQVSIGSIYHHMFESKIRLDHDPNDFSAWIAHVMGEPRLARKIARLDPYFLTLEQIRARIVDLIRSWRPTP